MSADSTVSLPWLLSALEAHNLFVDRPDRRAGGLREDTPVRPLLITIWAHAFFISTTRSVGLLSSQT